MNEAAIEVLPVLEWIGPALDWFELKLERSGIDSNSKVVYL